MIKKCEECLCKSLTVDNCLEYLVDADRYNAGHLKPLVIKFVVDNCREVVTQEGWREKLIKFPAIFAEFLQRQSSAEEGFLEIKEPYLYPGFREVNWQI